MARRAALSRSAAARGGGRVGERAIRLTKTVMAEVFGLFVDDGSFALAILFCLVLACWRLPHVDLASGIKAPVLFVGLGSSWWMSGARRARK
jgi:hypothetical protein